jgi:hypothetical protein
VVDEDERVVLWAGEFSTDADFDLAQELALEVRVCLFVLCLCV